MIRGPLPRPTTCPYASGMPEFDAELLEQVAARLVHDGTLEIRTMFRSPGIRAGGKIVAFLGRDGGLIVKLPRQEAIELIERGAADEVTMGKRTMREWVHLPAAGDREATIAAWTPITQQSLDYVTSLEGPGPHGDEKR